MCVVLYHQIGDNLLPSNRKLIPNTESTIVHTIKDEELKETAVCVFLTCVCGKLVIIVYVK